MNDPRKRHCHVCGKPLTCDCYYADYGLVKLDGCGHTYIEFDACPDCLNKVLVAMKQALIFVPIAKVTAEGDEKRNGNSGRSE